MGGRREFLVGQPAKAALRVGQPAAVECRIEWSAPLRLVMRYDRKADVQYALRACTQLLYRFTFVWTDPVGLFQFNRKPVLLKCVSNHVTVYI